MQYFMYQILPIIVVFGVALFLVYAHHWWVSRRSARRWKRKWESYEQHQKIMNKIRSERGRI